MSSASTGSAWTVTVGAAPDHPGQGASVDLVRSGCTDPGRGGPIETDQGVEMHQAAVLVLGNLGVLNRREFFNRDSGM